jgi:hypothetical protein
MARSMEAPRNRFVVTARLETGPAEKGPDSLRTKQVAAPQRPFVGAGPKRMKHRPEGGRNDRIENEDRLREAQRSDAKPGWGTAPPAQSSTGQSGESGHKPGSQKVQRFRRIPTGLYILPTCTQQVRVVVYAREA